MMCNIITLFPRTLCTFIGLGECYDKASMKNILANPSLYAFHAIHNACETIEVYKRQYFTKVFEYEWIDGQAAVEGSDLYKIHEIFKDRLDLVHLLIQAKRVANEKTY